jgi:hypothetical protein
VKRIKDEGGTPTVPILLPPFFCLSCLGIQWSGRTERMDHWQENEGRRMILFFATDLFASPND